MKILNKVGLEGEFFVTKNGNLVYPGDYGFDYDEYIILGEFRSDPGKTRAETIGNFYQEITRIRNLAKRNKVEVDFSGYKEITPQFKSEILRRMGSKEISQSRNIYKTDILSLSDDVIEDGVIVRSYISTGLHVHFSREAFYKEIIEGKTYTDRVYLITPSQEKRIIRYMDNNILEEHNLGVNLKFRNPGFYENKFWGFEYRSLPMYSRFLELEELEKLVNLSFIQLEKLSK